MNPKLPRLLREEPGALKLGWLKVLKAVAAHDEAVRFLPGHGKGLLQAHINVPVTRSPHGVSGPDHSPFRKAEGTDRAVGILEELQISTAVGVDSGLEPIPGLAPRRESPMCMLSETLRCLR